MPSFKSYCWSVGNTSFRVKELAYKNELQLRTLNRLFDENPSLSWGPVLEEKYYDLLTEVKIVEGTAPNKAKDAREISSGLADLGLIDRKTRKLTEIGEKINKISFSSDYSSNNIFEIERDSYVYLLQMLKLQVDVDQIHIKPFVALIYMLIKLNYLTKEEFTYFLPICKSSEDVSKMIIDIMKYRNNGITIDEILLKKIFEMDNYSDSYNILINAKVVNEDIMEQIGMNRKSGSYDRPFANVYNDLKKLCLGHSMTESERTNLIKKLKSDLSRVNKNQAADWYKLLSLYKNTKIDDTYIEKIYKLDLLNCNNEKEFKRSFFEIWHLMKWKSTLEDYYDLNKRYFNLTDIIMYSGSKFELSEIAKFYFGDIVDKIFNKPLIEKSEYIVFYQKDVTIDKIYAECNITTNQIVKKINEQKGISIAPADLQKYIYDNKNMAFINMIDSQFTKDILLELLDCFKNRNDSRIKELITDEATPSTSFEYILGIIWYNISGRNGHILDYMKLHLDANMLPKTHASGGDADLIFKYDSNNFYPKHDLLLEVTLSESTGQRQMEWEPVSRHLENHIKLQTHNEKDYVIFVAGILDDRTIKTFRTQKVYDFEDKQRKYEGLKIIPINTDILKYIINNKIDYNHLYKVFDESYNSELFNMPWFNETINKKFL